MRKKTKAKLKEIMEREDDSLVFEFLPTKEIEVTYNLTQHDIDQILQYEFHRVPKKPETKDKKLQEIFQGLFKHVKVEV